MKEAAEADEPEIYSVHNKLCVAVGTGAMAVLKYVEEFAQWRHFNACSRHYK